MATRTPFARAKPRATATSSDDSAATAYEGVRSSNASYQPVVWKPAGCSSTAKGWSRSERVVRHAAPCGSRRQSASGSSTARRRSPSMSANAAQSASRPLSSGPLTARLTPPSAVPELLGHPIRSPFLHECRHAFARLGGVIEGPEHGLVVDQPIALVEHAFGVHTRVGRGLEDLADCFERGLSQPVVGSDA